MAKQDRVLSTARLVLRAFLYANIAAAVLFAVAILLSFPLPIVPGVELDLLPCMD